MTLVLSYVSDEFIVQVSDRRLSRGGTPLPSEFNKAVVWCRFAVVGYTGFAFVHRRQRQPDDQVDEWIMETLYRRLSVRDVVDALATEAGKWVTAMPGQWRAQAFSIVGWAPQPDGRVAPFAALVSNFHSDQGQVLASTRPDFTRIVEFPREGEWHVFTVGTPLRGEESRAMRKAIIRSQGKDPARIADVLVHVVRNVSGRVPSLVGPAVMVACIPRPDAANPAPFMLTERQGRPTLDSPSFFYRGENPDLPRSYAPLFVCGDRGNDFAIEYLNESGSDLDITMRLRAPRGEPGFPG